MVLLLVGGVPQAKGQPPAASQAEDSGGWNVSKYADDSTFPSSGSLLLGWDYSRCTWEPPYCFQSLFQVLLAQCVFVMCPCKAEGCPITECLPHSLCRFIGPGLLPITEEVKHVIHSTHAGLYALAGLSSELESLKASQPATTVVHRLGGKWLLSSAALLAAKPVGVTGTHCSCGLRLHPCLLMNHFMEVMLIDCCWHADNQGVLQSQDAAAAADAAAGSVFGSVDVIHKVLLHRTSVFPVFGVQGEPAAPLSQVSGSKPHACATAACTTARLCWSVPQHDLLACIMLHVR